MNAYTILKGVIQSLKFKKLGKKEVCGKIIKILFIKKLKI